MTWVLTLGKLGLKKYIFWIQKDKACVCLQCRRPRFNPWGGSCPGEGNGSPLQYSCWKIPWMAEPGRLPSTGSQRVGHDWARPLQYIHIISVYLIVSKIPSKIKIILLTLQYSIFKTHCFGNIRLWHI